VEQGDEEEDGKKAKNLDCHTLSRDTAKCLTTSRGAFRLGKCMVLCLRENKNDLNFTIKYFLLFSLLRKLCIRSDSQTSVFEN
jgi:hypothetical protein